MRILITSGTGKVGREVMRGVLAKGHEPVIMTHSLEHLRDLPEGVEGVLGDFKNPQTWREALAGIDKLCLITPAMKDEAQRGSEFAKLACECGVGHISLLSIYYAEAGSHISHFFAKLEMESIIKKSGVPYTFIRANNFFQNDREILPFILDEGMFLLPLGNMGLNRVDLRDAADALTNSLTGTGHGYETYPVLGSDVLTGRKMAALYTEMLGRRVIYPEDCLERWEEKFIGRYPRWLFEDKKMMYEFLLLEGQRARGDALTLRDKILERPARSYRDYVEELLSSDPKEKGKPGASRFREREAPGPD